MNNTKERMIYLTVAIMIILVIAIIIIYRYFHPIMPIDLLQSNTTEIDYLDSDKRLPITSKDEINAFYKILENASYTRMLSTEDTGDQFRFNVHVSDSNTEHGEVDLSITKDVLMINSVPYRADKDLITQVYKLLYGRYKNRTIKGNKTA